MFTVEVNEFSSKTDKLLSNIETLLREHNELLRQGLSMSDSKQVEDNKNENKANTSVKECKYCGGTHNNKGEFLACSRKYKKEVQECKEQL